MRETCPLACNAACALLGVSMNIILEQSFCMFKAVAEMRKLVTRICRLLKLIIETINDFIAIGGLVLRPLPSPAFVSKCLEGSGLDCRINICKCLTWGMVNLANGFESWHRGINDRACWYVRGWLQFNARYLAIRTNEKIELSFFFGSKTDFLSLSWKYSCGNAAMSFCKVSMVLQKGTEICSRGYLNHIDPAQVTFAILVQVFVRLY